MDGKPFVFISYAHRDSAAVLNCINAMKRSGITIWYDEGIEAGSEWPEFIAEKVLSCSKFVLFVTDAYLASQNCKRELNFAISHKKDILSVFLEDVVLSPGMEMQLGTYQAIYRSRFGNDEALCNSLCAEGFFNTCRNGNTTETTSQPRTVAANTSAGERPSSAETSGNTSSSERPQSTQTASGNSSADYVDQFKTAFGSLSSSVFGKKEETDEAERPLKNRLLAAVLAFFGGGLGLHKFYLGQTVPGILYLVFCWTYIPTILGIVEAIKIFLASDEEFEEKYKCIVL